MATDDACGDLATRMHSRSRDHIDGELRRLARRAQLRSEDLAVIDAALDDLVESMVLSRMRQLPQHAHRLGTLFDIGP